MSLEHLALVGRTVTLAPLAHTHVAGLWSAAKTIQEAAKLTPIPCSEEEAERYVTQALNEHARDLTLAYAVVDRVSDEVVGSTRFTNIERWRLAGRQDAIDVVEIGRTFLAASAQRTRTNTEMKCLMLTHAFEALDVHRVTIKTDALNQRSRTAIERIGATFEGILRSHMPSASGGVRDTAMYSIIRSDWHSVRERLHSLLGE